MNRPTLPPILNTKEYESLVEKYKQEEEKQRQYCYKPYRTLHNYQITIKHDLPLSFPQLGGISVENYKQLSVICFKCYYKWSNKQGCLIYLFSTSVWKSVSNTVEYVWNCCQIVWILCGLNVIIYSDLTEQSITRTRFNCQTLVYILSGYYIF